MIQLTITNPQKAKPRRILLSAFATMYGMNAMAQNGEAADYASSLSLFSSPLFLVLLGVIVLLAIFIAVFAGVLKDVAATHQNAISSKNKEEGVSFNQKDNAGKKGWVAGLLPFALFFTSQQKAFAQTSGNTEFIAKYIDIPSGIFYTMLLLIGIEILILIVFMSLIKLFVKKEKIESAIIEEEPSLLEIMNASVALEDEHEILFDHEYDGIRELDNDLPPWWKYGFYLTIIVSVLYLFNYHVSGTGPLQLEEYATSLEKARIATEEYQLMNANNVNENNALLLTDAAELENGKKVYLEMCFACHGKHGEGGVGPNLTDEYWIHGGSLKDIFSSIKYGWPNKGMKSWQADIPPIQIHQIASFIKSLKGSAPANAKAQQGELYTEILIATDSLATDSTVILSSTEIGANESQ